MHDSARCQIEGITECMTVKLLWQSPMALEVLMRYIKCLCMLGYQLGSDSAIFPPSVVYEGARHRPINPFVTHS